MTNRVTDLLMADQAYAKGRQSAMVNLTNGGQNGYATDPSSWVANSAYVRKDVFAILIDAPSGFKLLPNPELWFTALKKLIELHPKTIDGLNSKITVDWSSESPVGRAGEIQQDWTHVTRERSNPSFGWIDKKGRPIQNFWEDYINILIANPETQVPDIVTYSGVKITDQLPDFNTFTVLFIEPDPTFTKPEKAWLCANMAPKDAGDKIGKKDVTAGGEQLELTIEFTALTQVGFGVMNFAATIMSSLNLANANPNLRNAFTTSIGSDVAAVAGGFANGISTLGTNTVSRN